MIIAKIILRLIALPFVAGIVIIAAIRNYLFTLYRFMRYGGDLSVFDPAFNPQNIKSMFDEAQSQRFCYCDKKHKSGSTSAMHCNQCGKLEQSETWLK